MDVPVHFVRWKKTHRIIPVRQEGQRVFDKIGKSGDFEALDTLDQATREPREIPRDHANETFRYQSESRFSDGTFGIYYAAKGLHTALKESIYHRELFLGDTHQPPILVYSRLLLADVEGRFHDVRKLKKTMPHIYSPKRDDYRASQSLGSRLKEEGSAGICYDSVRDPKGMCIAVFERSRITHCREERWFGYRWNGQQISEVLELRSFLNFSKTKR